MSRLPIALALAALAGAGLSAAPAHAQQCAASPVSQSFADPAGDDSPNDPDELGFAPDIVSIDVSMTASCAVSIGVQLGDHSFSGSLYEGETVAIFLDTDGNPGTGSGGADKLLVQHGPGSRDRDLGTWNGSGFTMAPAPGMPNAWGGMTAPAASLGITGSTNLGVFTFARFVDTFPVIESVDWAPDDSSLLRVPLTFASVKPPPPPPPPPRPAPDPRPAPPPAAKTCRVPNVVGMTAKRATARLDRAGCRYRTRTVRARRRGRVVATSPRAGATTTRTVVLRVARRRQRP